MKFRKLLEAANKLAEENPEFLDLDVCQTSCFDSPYRFDTNNIIFIGETFDVVNPEDEEEIFSSFKDEDSANDRAQEEGGKVVKRDTIVFEAF